MSKDKTRKATITFRPPLKAVNGSRALVHDEVLAEGVSIHIERMSDEAIWMSIATDEVSYGFDFVVGEQDITNDEGESVRPLRLTAYKM